MVNALFSAGTASYVTDPNDNLVTLTIPEIIHSGSGTTGTIRVELWAFYSPYTGGSQTGYELSDYTFGQLGANQYYTPSVKLADYTDPPIGADYYALLLTEYTGGTSDGGFSLDDYVDFTTGGSGSSSTTGGTSGGGSTGSGSTTTTTTTTTNTNFAPVKFNGTATATINPVTSKVTVGIPIITNTSSTAAANTLTIEIRASFQTYSTGNPIGSLLTDDVLSIQLGAGQSSSATSVTLPYMAPPPNGSYRVYMFLEESNPSGGTTVEDFVTFSTALVSNATRSTFLTTLPVPSPYIQLPIVAAKTQTITIVGSNFGTLPAYDGDSPYLSITDITQNWTAGAPGDPVTLAVTSWTDKAIVVSGFSGAYGQGNLVLKNNDTLSYTVTNPQTGGTSYDEIVSVTTITDTVAQAIQATHAPVYIKDSAANISAAIDPLQSLTAAGTILGVTLTDSGIPALTMTLAQAVADGATLAKITGTSYSLSISADSTSHSFVAPAGIGTTVSFSGTASAYTITTGNGGVTVSNGSIADHLIGVTALHFTDLTEIVASTTATISGGVSSAQVANLYSAVFGRLPDAAGLAYYENIAATNPAATMATFAEWFLQSPEYTGNSAHNYAPTPAGDSQFITDIYTNLLHRAPEAGAVSWYLTNVIEPMGGAKSSSTELVARATLLADFSQSAEFLGDVSITPQHKADTQHWLLLI